MSIIMNNPLHNVYKLSEEDFNGLWMEYKEMNEETAAQCSGKSHTRRATSKELKMLKGSK